LKPEYVSNQFCQEQVVINWVHESQLGRCATFAREGVEISGSAMADRVGASYQLLSPLLTALRNHVFAARKLYTCDTLMAVPAPMPGTGQTK
jgi:hypothetical protein